MDSNTLDQHDSNPNKLRTLTKWQWLPSLWIATSLNVNGERSVEVGLWLETHLNFPEEKFNPIKLLLEAVINKDYIVNQIIFIDYILLGVD